MSTATEGDLVFDGFDELAASVQVPKQLCSRGHHLAASGANPCAGSQGTRQDPVLLQEERSHRLCGMLNPLRELGSPLQLITRPFVHLTPIKNKVTSHPYALKTY